MLRRFISRSRDRRRRWTLALGYAALLVSCESPFAPDVVRPARLDITPNVLQLVVAGTATLTARVFDDASVLMPAANVFWSSQNPSVVTVNQDGLVTGVSAGTAQIAASSGGLSSTIAVTVEQRPIALIRVTPSAGSVIVGQGLPLLGEALDVSGSVLPNRTLLWETSNASIATVSSAGLVTGVGVGVATISASGEGKTGTSVVTVLPAPVASISVTPDGGTIPVGSTLQLTPTPRDATGQPLTDRTLAWQSSHEAVATVSSNGLVTAIAPGTASITVSAPGGGANGTTPTTTVTVTVLLAAVASAVIVPSPATVQVGQVVTFTVNLFDAGGGPLSATGRTIVWETSQPTIATVSQGGTATGVSVGVATLTASVTTPGHPAPTQTTVQLTVVNQPVVSVQVTPAPATVHVGSVYQRTFSATPRDAGGQPLVGRSVVWTSSNQAVAVVDALTGTVTGIGPGTVQIRATCEGVEGVAQVTVDLVPVTSVTVTPPAVNLTPPETVQLVAVPLDSAGHPITGSALGGRGTGWGTSNAPAATVGTGGLVTAVAQGNATITATIGGTAGQASVSVGAVPIATITVTPTPQSVTIGSGLQLTATARDATNNVLTGRPFTWASGNTSLLLVDQSGFVTPVAVGGPVTVTASAEGKVGTALVTVVPRPAVKLTMVTQPSAVAQSGVSLTQQPAVRLRDALDGNVSQPGVVVTASIASGGGSLSGTLTATTNPDGIATFSSLTITGPAGPYTLAFASPSLVGVTSGTIVVGAGGASQLAVTTQPSPTAQNAVALALQPAVALRDAANNPVAVAGVTVTASIATGAGTLGGTLTATTDATGTATFLDLAITGTAGAFTLSFAAPGLGSATSGPITLSAGAPAAIAMATQPAASATNTQVLPAQPVVRVTDSGGNPVPHATTITATLVGPGATLGGTVAVPTDLTGAATFTDLAITGLAGSYALQFGDGVLAPVTSSAIVLGASAATQLAITTQPSPAPQNAIPFPVQPVIQLQDVSGNPVAQGGVNVTAAITAPGTGLLGGTLTATTDAAGAATFTGLTITGLVGARTLDFSSALLTGVTSAPVVLQPGIATQLALATPPPANVTSGEVFVTAPVVRLRDVSGNDVPQAGVNVLAAIATGSGATLSGTSATTDGSGAATFATMALTGTAGPFTLNFTSGSLTSVQSGTLTLSAGTGSKLAITTPPSSAVTNAVAFPVQPAIQLQDASNNPVSQAGVTVFAVIASGGGTLGGTTSAITNGAGLATFTDLAITGTTGNRTLLFSASGYLPVSSGAINVGVGAPTSVTISTPPSAAVQSGVVFLQQPQILVRDISLNPAPGVVVTAAVASGAGTLGGTLTATTNASGEATFTNLVITGTTGNRTLSFTIPGPIAATSGTVAVAAGAPASLSITTQPSASVPNAVVFPQQPVIQVNDGAGNGVPGVVVTASVATGAGTLGGTLTATTSATGAASFTDLRITGATGTRTLRFSGASLSATSTNVSVTVGTATSLTITTQPSASAANDAAFAQQPAVTITDVSGNPVSGVVVTASILSGGGTLSGTVTATTNASGVASWTGLGLKITGTIGTRTLQFSGASLSATSNNVAVTPGAVTQLAITTAPPASVTNAVAFTTQPVIQLRDVSGNNVPTAGTTVTATIASGAGSLTGGTAVATNASGTATFATLAITGAVGDRTLRFSITVPSAINVTSGTVTVTTGAASSLTITTQPSASVANDAAFAQQPAVTITDVSGNPVSGVVVTASILSGGGTLGGTTTATTNASGVASWTGLGLKITGTVGTRTLRFAGASLSATSTNVSVTAGTATSLTITTQPSASVANDAAFAQQPAVTITDVSGNPVSGVLVTASILSGGGTLGGTVTATTNASGVASWTGLGLKITGTVGTRTLQFSGASLSATSNNVSVTVGTATSLTITTQPSASVANDAAFAQQPAVTITDVSGNPVSGVLVTASILSGGGTLGGTVTATTNASGVASWTGLGLKITGTVGTRTLQFSGASLSATSNDVSVTFGAATQLSITTQPSANATSGVVFPQQPVIQLLDVSGNVVSQAGVAITVALASGTGTLGTTLVVNTIADGSATFGDLAITGSGSHTLQFTAAGLTPVVSNAIVLP